MDNPDLCLDCLQKTGTKSARLWVLFPPGTTILVTGFLAFAGALHTPAPVTPAQNLVFTELSFGLHHFSLAPQTGVCPFNLLFPISLWNHLLIYLLVFVAALLRYSHTIMIHPFKVHNSVVFSIFKELFSDHLSQYQNIFITLKGNPIPTGSHSTFLQTQPQSQATISFLSVSMDFLILDILYKWNHVIYCPL